MIIRHSTSTAGKTNSSHFFFFFFFDLWFTARQYYFNHFEPIQLVGGGENGKSPGEKPPDHLQDELGL